MSNQGFSSIPQANQGYYSQPLVQRDNNVGIIPPLPRVEENQNVFQPQEEIVIREREEVPIVDKSRVIPQRKKERIVPVVKQQKGQLARRKGSKKQQREEEVQIQYEKTTQIPIYEEENVTLLQEVEGTTTYPDYY